MPLFYISNNTRIDGNQVIIYVDSFSSALHIHSLRIINKNDSFVIKIKANFFSLPNDRNFIIVPHPKDPQKGKKVYLQYKKEIWEIAL